MVVNYFRKIGVRRLFIMIIGNVFPGMGVGMSKLSGLDNDPSSDMVMTLANILGFSYVSFLLVTNGGFFIFELAIGRRLIGVDTLANTLLLGYIATFLNGLWPLLPPMSDTTLLRMVTALVGAIATSLGVPLYQIPNAGVTLCGSIFPVTTKSRSLTPYFWHRATADAVCTAVCLLTRGIIGLGVLVSAFGLGSVVHFFNAQVARWLVKDC